MEERPYFIVNVEAAIVRNGRYLLIRRSSAEEHAGGMLSLPGGKVEHEATSPEALEIALRREVEEETGLVLGTVHYVESKVFTMDTGEWCLSICFFCNDCRGDARPKSKDEVDEVLWLGATELDQQANCPAWTKQSIRSAGAFGLDR